MRRPIIIDWNYILNATTDGLYSLLVTLAVLVMFTLLLMSGRIASDNPLILTGFGLISAFWFSGAAHRWGSSVSQQSSQPSQPSPQLSDTQIDQIVAAVLAKQIPPTNGQHPQRNDHSSPP